MSREKKAVWELRAASSRGGKLAASRMTAKQRTARARKAGKAGAAARWGKKAPA